VTKQKQSENTGWIQPRKPDEQLAPERKERALILTVGLSQSGDEQIIDSLIADIRSFQPVRVVLLATAESRSNAEEIARQLAWQDEQYEIVQLKSAHDLREAFQLASEAIRRSIAAGFPPERISINYTSGTKVMSTGLVLAATHLSCETLRYIKHDPSGVARKSSMTSPRAVFAYRDLTTAIHLFEELRFLTARETAMNIDETLLTATDLQSLHNLRELAQAYFYWDHFRYGEFLCTIAQVNEQGALSPAYQVSDERRAMIAAIARAIEEARFEPLIFADIFNNALRRHLVGSYEDATVRCHRALEMLAQWTLTSEFQIDTDRLNTRKVPAKYRPTYEALRSLDDGKVKIGLHKAFALLQILEHPLGRAFDEHPQTAVMLERRRQAMMAHGVRPMIRTESKALIVWTAAIVNSAIPDFKATCEVLQFTWLAESSAELLNNTGPPETPGAAKPQPNAAPPQL
jgi:CRISPR-associated protein (TIGR02710 family)